MSTPASFPADSVPGRLLALLDHLGRILARRGDAVALIGLGSVGLDLHRLDEHSDADFFVVVDGDPAQRRYLGDLDWLEELGEIAFSFVNSPHGRKVLFGDGLFAEYAVFTLAELATAGYPPGRLVWSRADAPHGIERPTVPLPGPPSLEEQIGEALTNLYVGLHRDLRGERLTAMRFIQVHALDRLLAILGLLGLGEHEQQDVFVVERGAERRFGGDLLPLERLAAGYQSSAEAALCLLEILSTHVAVEPALAREIRRLAALASQSVGGGQGPGEGIGTPHTLG